MYSLTFGAAGKTVGLLEKHGVYKLNTPVRTIRAINTNTTKQPVATALGWLLGRISFQRQIPVLLCPTKIAAKNQLCKKKTANNKTQTHHEANGIMTICNHQYVLCY